MTAFSGASIHRQPRSGIICGYVCFGSLADIAARSRHVRFTPESGHAQRQHRCLLCAISGRPSRQALQPPFSANIVEATLPQLGGSAGFSSHGAARWSTCGAGRRHCSAWGHYLGTASRAVKLEDGIIVVVEFGDTARGLLGDELIGKQEVVIESFRPGFQAAKSAGRWRKSSAMAGSASSSTWTLWSSCPINHRSLLSASPQPRHEPKTITADSTSRRGGTLFNVHPWR